MNLIVPLTKDLSGGVATLDVEDNQRDFIGAFESTLADVSERATGHVILNEGAPAGFFIIDLYYPTRYAFAAAGSVGLRSFLLLPTTRVKAWQGAHSRILPPISRRNE